MGKYKFPARKKNVAEFLKSCDFSYIRDGNLSWGIFDEKGVFYDY